MSSLLEWREKIQTLYAQYSTYIDKGIRFALALTSFLLITNNIGFMNKLTNPVVSVGLAVVCAFLPAIMTAVIAAGLMLAHMFTLSIGVAGIAAVMLLLMFIFYFRFTPKKAVILLLTPIAFVLKVPVLIPVVYGLIGTPIYVIPITFGTVVYFLIKYTKTFAGTLKGADNSSLMNVIINFVKQIMMSKELWVAAGAVIICFILVYAIRRMSVAHAWEIGAVSGAAAYIAVMAAGNIVLDTSIEYISLIVGCVLGAAVGYGMELMIFSVDYARTENLQFEDDEYYYYVKAVPKISVAPSEKRVKRINKHQETEPIDTKRVHKAVKGGSGQRTQLTGDMDIDKLIEKELTK